MQTFAGSAKLIAELAARREEVGLAAQTSGAEGDVVTKVSPRSVSETVERFTESVRAKGMKLFAVIDQAKEAREVGLELQATFLVIFGNPAAGTQVMEAAPLAALDLPLKVLIWSDGERTNVSYVSPSALAKRHGLSPDLASKLAGIDALTDSLVTS